MNILRIQKFNVKYRLELFKVLSMSLNNYGCFIYHESFANKK